MIVAIGWFLLGLCSVLLILIALSPLFVAKRHGSDWMPDDHCCVCHGCWDAGGGER